MAQNIEQIVKKQAKEIERLQKIVEVLDRRLRITEKMTTNVKENLRVTRNGLHTIARQVSRRSE